MERWNSDADLRGTSGSWKSPDVAWMSPNRCEEVSERGGVRSSGRGKPEHAGAQRAPAGWHEIVVAQGAQVDPAHSRAEDLAVGSIAEH